MDPISAAILGTAQLGTSWLSSSSARQANKQNIALAREQMQFQERMSNTQYQRAVKDLEEADLNPILAVTGGLGGSAPLGAKAVVENPEIGRAHV